MEIGGCQSEIKTKLKGLSLHRCLGNRDSIGEMLRCDLWGSVQGTWTEEVIMELKAS